MTHFLQRLRRRAAHRWPVGLALAALAWMAGATATQAFEVTDARGRTVAFAQPPQRIVSLLPSLTESV